MSELSSLIAGGINKTDSINSEQVKQDTISNYFVLAEYRCKVKMIELKVESRTFGTAFVLSSGTNAILGTSALGVGTAGSWTEVIEDTNESFITNTGRDEIAKWFAGEADNPITHFGYGTGTTAYNTSQTALVNEVQTRLNIETAITSTNKELELLSDEAFNVTQAGITEVGFFTASSSGVMYARRTFSAQTFDTSKWYGFRVKFTFTDNTSGSALIVDEGLNVIRDWTGNQSATAPTKTSWSDATGLPDSEDTASDWDAGGSNKQSNAFTLTTRTDNIVVFETILTTGQLNGVSITKSGNIQV